MENNRLPEVKKDGYVTATDLSLIRGRKIVTVGILITANLSSRGCLLVLQSRRTYVRPVPSLHK